MSMRLILLGAPGAGKGTQGKVLAEHFQVHHLAAGDMLRAEVAQATELGRAAKAYMDRGDFVPDELVIEMMLGRMVTSDEATGGYILDGFPRTLDQAKATADAALERGVRAHAAVYLRAHDEELVRRLLARGASGVGGRTDDTESVIRHRLELFHEKTQPMIDYYRDARGILVDVDAEETDEDVTRAILDKLEAHRAATSP